MEELSNWEDESREEPQVYRSTEEIRRYIIGKMRSEGYKRITRQEISVYQVVGPVSFNNIIHGAYQHAVQESKMLKVDNQNEKFTQLQNKWRKKLIEDIVEEIRTFHESMSHEEVAPHIEPYTSQEIFENIKKQVC